MGMKARARPQPRKGKTPDAKTLFRRDFWPYLLDMLEDEDIVPFLLVEFPTDENPFEGEDIDSEDRFVLEWLWGWFCGVASGRGITRKQLFDDLVE